MKDLCDQYLDVPSADTPKSDREILVLFESRARRRTPSGAPVSATAVKLTSTGYCGFFSNGAWSGILRRSASPSPTGALADLLNRCSVSPANDTCLAWRGSKRKESGAAGDAVGEDCS